MATTYIGRNGVITVGGSAVGNLRSFSIEETADTVETTTMGLAARTYSATLTSFTGSADVYWDPDDVGQDAITIGADNVSVIFQPEGNTPGDVTLTGTCIITGVSKSSSFDGLVEASITFQGDGAIVEGTVS